MQAVPLCGGLLRALHLVLLGAAQRVLRAVGLLAAAASARCTYRRSESHGLMSFLLVLILVVLVLLPLRLCML